MIHFLRSSSLLWQRIHRDLDRPHEFAVERVGFLFCRKARGSEGVGLIAAEYRAVKDSHYLQCLEMGALVGADGIREAMQHAYHDQYSVMHVHRHEHTGKPWFSVVDVEENNKLIPTFWNVAPSVPHGALLLSIDRARALVWDDPNSRRAHCIETITTIGQRIEDL